MSQEEIRDFLGRFNKQTYKERPCQSAARLYPGFFTNRLPGGRSDYYIYFYLHALALLNEKAAFCFVAP